jgi:hypothetical protein
MRFEIGCEDDQKLLLLRVSHSSTNERWTPERPAQAQNAVESMQNNRKAAQGSLHRGSLKGGARIIEAWYSAPSR